MTVSNKDLQKLEAGVSNARDAVLVKSDDVLLGTDIVVGYDFNFGLDYSQLFKSYSQMGFQASSLGNAIEIINEMVFYLSIILVKD